MKDGVKKISDFLKKLIAATLYFALFSICVFLMLWSSSMYAEHRTPVYAIIMMLCIPVVLLYIVTFLKAWDSLFESDDQKWLEDT